jgi:hypothetical protein
VKASKKITASSSKRKYTPRKLRGVSEAESDGEFDPPIDASPRRKTKSPYRRTRSKSASHPIYEIPDTSSSESLKEIDAPVQSRSLKKRPSRSQARDDPDIESDGEFDPPIDYEPPVKRGRQAFTHGPRDYMDLGSDSEGDRPLTSKFLLRRGTLDTRNGKARAKSAIEEDAPVINTPAVGCFPMTARRSLPRITSVAPVIDLDAYNLEKTPEPRPSGRTRAMQVPIFEGPQITSDAPSFSSISSDDATIPDPNISFDDADEMNESHESAKDVGSEDTTEVGEHSGISFGEGDESPTESAKAPRHSPEVVYEEKRGAATVKAAEKTRLAVTRESRTRSSLTEDVKSSSVPERRNSRKSRRLLANLATLDEDIIQIDWSKQSIDDILALPAPADEPEYVSFATARSGAPFFAPLIGGTAPDEEYRINQELAAASKKELPQHAHPEWIRLKSQEPWNFEKMLFYEGADPKKHYAIAGVSKEPLTIDPPGCGTPFDALKFPDQLVIRLNKNDPDQLAGWDEKSLKTIPASLIRLLNPEILAGLPDAVLAKQPQDIIDTLPSDCHFFNNLPANSKFKRPEHRAAAKKIIQHKKPRLSSESTETSSKAGRDKAGKFLKAPKMRDAAGKFLPRAKLVEGVVPDSKGKGKKPAEVSKPKRISPRTKTVATNSDQPTEPVPPASKAKCLQCATSGTKCNGEKPECFTCRLKGYTCSFKDEPDPGLSLTQLITAITHQTYLPLDLQEENFGTRPSIRISIPDHLKSLLVDDWEYVTKNMMLVPLPSAAPANFIIDTYYNEEKESRRIGSADADVLEEFCGGMKVYFEKALGKILLYRFERNQLAEVGHS